MFGAEWFQKQQIYNRLRPVTFWPSFCFLQLWTSTSGDDEDEDEKQ